MRRLLLYGVLVLAVVAGAIVALIYSGLYNVAATEAHTRLVYWLLNVAADRSIGQRAPDLPMPDLSDPELVTRGLRSYQARCRQCHGAPGVPPDEVALGMSPVPPNLMRSAREMEAGDIFWVVKHGIRMTGMPAWDYHIGDDEIWAIVAFVKRMALISPAEYREMAAEAGAPRQSGEEADAAEEPAAAAPDEGDPERGRTALRQYGCISCHEIPGVVGPRIRVGPPLDGIAERQFIAGVLPNTPQNMVRWIRRPQEVDPLTAMPDMGVSERHARDMAAYLYGLD